MERALVLVFLASNIGVKYTLHMPIRNKLRELRLKLEINQTEIAKACDVSRQTIHSIEVSKYTPSVELALRLANVLNLPVEDIFELEGGSNEK